MASTSTSCDLLTIAGKPFQSRLFTGTGKYPDLTQMQQSIERSGCQMVTVAVRRVQAVAVGHAGLMEAIDWSKIWMLPNTAGCATADEAVRVAYWAVSCQAGRPGGQHFVKLEVIPDSRHPAGSHRHPRRRRTAGG